MGSRHTRRSKKQVGGRSIDIYYVVAYIYTYLSSREYKYRTFRNAESVKRLIKNIMENDDYDFVHRAGKAWNESYSYEEFLNLFLVFDRFCLKTAGDFLTKSEAKKILENEFNFYEDETMPNQLKNLANAYKSMPLIKEISKIKGLPENMNSEIGYLVSGFNKRSYENQLALLNAKAQKLGVSLAPRENSWTKRLRLSKKTPPSNNTE